MPSPAGIPAAAQHEPRNAMRDPAEIARFHDRCSDLMRALLEELATTPGRPRPFPEIEDALGWPRRRIASVLGGVSRLRLREFGGRRPYRFLDEHGSPSGRWELWMDAEQARAVPLPEVRLSGLSRHEGRPGATRSPCGGRLVDG